MRPLRALLLGAVAYGIFLLATLPASVVASLAASATEGRIRLLEARGTAWHGSARVEASLPGATIALDELRWRWLASRLATGRVAFAIEARLGTLHAEAEAARSPTAWHLADLRAKGDGSAIAALHPLAAAWQPAGAVAIEAKALSWDGRNAGGGATLEWRDAALALSPARPLGSWRAQAVAEGPAFRIAVTTLAGPLRITGQGTLPIRGRLAFTGEASAEPARARELQGLLDLLGPRRADGAHALSIR
ncbi:MAG: type II secretion system protein N [Burkholderiales bacterium]